MYQIFFDKNGKKQHEMCIWSPIQYWNDACWHRAIPKSTINLTYLDVGSHAGLCCLRFEQRGGTAIGLDYHLSKIVEKGSEELFLGLEQTHPEYLWVKNEFNSQYKVLVGGFDENGEIIPQLGQFSIVSCLNVLEYIPNLRQCIDGLFKVAKDRVIIAIDVDISGATRSSSEINLPWPMKWMCNLDDFLSWMKWPVVYWIFDTGINDISRYQLFVASTNPESNLQIDDSPIVFDLDKSETEKFFQIRQ